MKIYKYPIGITSYQAIGMPKGAKIIKVDHDPNNIPCLWAIVDEKNKKISKDIFIYGTGEKIIDGDNYVGTFIKGNFVWHVFES